MAVVGWRVLPRVLPARLGLLGLGPEREGLVEDASCVVIGVRPQVQLHVAR